MRAVAHGPAVVAIDLSEPNRVEQLPQNPALSIARNGWTDFVLQVDCAQFPAHPILLLPRFAGVELSAFQVLPVPLESKDAAYVRQTGETGGTQQVPRVLLPLAVRNGAVDLSQLRDPAQPARADVHPSYGPALIWIDLHAASDSAAVDKSSQCELTDAVDHQSAGVVPVKLTVQNLTLPAEPHLHFSAPLDWDALAALQPQLQPIKPRLLSRSNSAMAPAIDLLDRYLQLAHENKTDFFIPRLQPIVKWPLGRPPDVDWTDFDSMVEPWFTGRAFADHQPVGFWPMPGFDSLGDFDLNARIQYWHQAALHFDQWQFLDRMPVVLQRESMGSPIASGSITEADSLLLSSEARQILTSHPRVTAMLPMQDDQTQLVSPANPSAIGLESTSRLITVAPGLVCASPIRDWPTQALPPRHWIDAAATGGPLETTGLSTEQGIRTLAWLAFSRDASLVLCGNPLPVHLSEALHPQPGNRLTLCYPGAWFATDAPLATIQLKWLREAEQDYEYLMLASQADDRAVSLSMCQLTTRPLQLQAAQKPEPVFDLLAGPVDPRTSDEARQILIERISAPTKSSNKSSAPAQLQTLRWFTAHQRPTLLAGGVQWLWNLDPDNADVATESGKWIDARLRLHLYNPAAEMAAGSTLQWPAMTGGWEPHPSPIEIPGVKQYQVGTYVADARFDLNRIGPDSRQPIEVDFVDGFTGQSVPCRMMLPIAVSERRKQPLSLDGSLNDWYAADAVQLDQPLVRMFNRAALQSQQLQLADTLSSIYTAWSEENFYVAFRLGGVTAADLRSTRNFVQYDHGRAWGEDLCEMLIQPVYVDNTIGPTLHVVCKPGGNWVEQQSPDPTGTNPPPWQPFEASAVRYASGVDPDQRLWRGEVAIPWKAIAAPNHARPGLLRFNFIQHQQSTAQSASWAGPIDQSRNTQMSGLLLLKE